MIIKCLKINDMEESVLVLLVLEVDPVDNEGVIGDDGSSPEVGGVVLVGGLDGSKRSLDEVSSGSGLTLSLGVDVVNTGELEELLGHGGSNEASSTGSGDESDFDGSGLSSDLSGDGVGGTDLVTPISLSDGDEIELGHSDGSLDGALHFLVAFPSQTDVVLLITNNGVSFEAGALTSLGLLLHGLHLHNFFLEVASEEGVNDLLLLDGDGEAEDIDDVFDELGLDESAQLSDGLPLDLLLLPLGALAALAVSALGKSSSLSLRLGCCGGRGCLFSH